MDDLMRVQVADGKYEVVQDSAGRLSALRHGEQWRDLTGDGLVFNLAHELFTARQQLDALLNHCDKEGGECSECSRIICPHADPMHFHHDGCPSCA